MFGVIQFVGTQTKLLRMAAQAFYTAFIVTGNKNCCGIFYRRFKLAKSVCQLIFTFWIKNDNGVKAVAKCRVNIVVQLDGGVQPAFNYSSICTVAA